MTIDIVVDHTDRSVVWPGIHAGPTTLVAIDREAKVLVLFIRGHTTYVDAWTGNAYVPATYSMHRYVEASRDGNQKERFALRELFGETRWRGTYKGER